MAAELPGVASWKKLFDSLKSGDRIDIEFIIPGALPQKVGFQIGPKTNSDNFEVVYSTPESPSKISYATLNKEAGILEFRNALQSYILGSYVPRDSVPKDPKTLFPLSKTLATFLESLSGTVPKKSVTFGTAQVAEFYNPNPMKRTPATGANPRDPSTAQMSDAEKAEAMFNTLQPGDSIDIEFAFPDGFTEKVRYQVLRRIDDDNISVAYDMPGSPTGMVGPTGGPYRQAPANSQLRAMDRATLNRKNGILGLLNDVNQKYDLDTYISARTPTVAPVMPTATPMPATSQRQTLFAPSKLMFPLTNPAAAPAPVQFSPEVIQNGNIIIALSRTAAANGNPDAGMIAGNAIYKSLPREVGAQVIQYILNTTARQASTRTPSTPATPTTPFTRTATPAATPVAAPIVPVAAPVWPVPSVPAPVPAGVPAEPELVKSPVAFNGATPALKVGDVLEVSYSYKYVNPTTGIPGGASGVFTGEISYIDRTKPNEIAYHFRRTDENNFARPLYYVYPIAGTGAPRGDFLMTVRIDNDNPELVASIRSEPADVKVLKMVPSGYFTEFNVGDYVDIEMATPNYPPAVMTFNILSNSGNAAELKATKGNEILVMQYDTAQNRYYFTKNPGMQLSNFRFVSAGSAVVPPEFGVTAGKVSGEVPKPETQRTLFQQLVDQDYAYLQSLCTHSALYRDICEDAEFSEKLYANRLQKYFPDWVKFKDAELTWKEIYVTAEGMKVGDFGPLVSEATLHLMGKLLADPFKTDTFSKAGYGVLELRKEIGAAETNMIVELDLPGAAARGNLDMTRFIIINREEPVNKSLDLYFVVNRFPNLYTDDLPFNGFDPAILSDDLVNKMKCLVYMLNAGFVLDRNIAPSQYDKLSPKLEKLKSTVFYRAVRAMMVWDLEMQRLEMITPKDRKVNDQLRELTGWMQRSTLTPEQTSKLRELEMKRRLRTATADELKAYNALIALQEQTRYDKRTELDKVRIVMRELVAEDTRIAGIVPLSQTLAGAAQRVASIPIAGATLGARGVRRVGTIFSRPSVPVAVPVSGVAPMAAPPEFAQFDEYGVVLPVSPPVGTGPKLTRKFAAMRAAAPSRAPPAPPGAPPLPSRAPPTTSSAPPPPSNAPPGPSATSTAAEALAAEALAAGGTASAAPVPPPVPPAAATAAPPNPATSTAAPPNPASTSATAAPIVAAAPVAAAEEVVPPEVEKMREENRPMLAALTRQSKRDLNIRELNKEALEGAADINALVLDINSPDLIPNLTKVWETVTQLGRLYAAKDSLDWADEDTAMIRGAIAGIDAKIDPIKQQNAIAKNQTVATLLNQIDIFTNRLIRIQNSNNPNNNPGDKLPEK